MIYEKTGTDSLGDDYELTVNDYGDIELEVNDRTSGEEGVAAQVYTPEGAEKLAKRLKKAARLARAAK